MEMYESPNRPIKKEKQEEIRHFLRSSTTMRTLSPSPIVELDTEFKFLLNERRNGFKGFEPNQPLLDDNRNNNVIAPLTNEYFGAEVKLEPKLEMEWESACGIEQMNSDDDEESFWQVFEAFANRILETDALEKNAIAMEHDANGMAASESKAT